MGKSGKKVLTGIVAGCIVLVAYTIWDNHRLTVAEQDIAVEDLPGQLENFSILQISDFHEKEFGNKQERLINTINSLDYDVLVFTGDMLDNEQSRNYEPFYTVLEGINNKEHLYFVSGNADPPSYQVSPSFEKSEFIKGLEKRGVTFLESFAQIDVDGASVHFVNFELSIIKDPKSIGSIAGVIQPDYISNENYLDYQKQLWSKMEEQDVEDSDLLVALNHFPVADARVDYIQQDSATVWRDFDLIIAGHYHGGQIRLPFFGAIFVPEAWSATNAFFRQETGWTDYGSTRGQGNMSVHDLAAVMPSPF